MGHNRHEEIVLPDSVLDVLGPQLEELNVQIVALKSRLDHVRTVPDPIDQRGQAEEILERWLGLISDWFEKHVGLLGDDLNGQEMLAIFFWQQAEEISKLAHSYGIDSLPHASFIGLLDEILASAPV